MKIAQSYRKTVPFESIEVGEVFRFREVLYMKTIPSAYNAIRLVDGQNNLIPKYQQVELIDGEFVIKNA